MASPEPQSAPSAARRARDRVRAAISGEILDAARAELDDAGAADLSLRAVARRLGMAPSALYRYFPSRDSLLTTLIVESYQALGAAAAEADARAEQAGAAPRARWLAVCSEVRSWAAAAPRRWALLYGSPVPGYAAPDTTVEPAAEVVRVVCRIVLDAGGGAGAGAVLPRSAGTAPGSVGAGAAPGSAGTAPGSVGAGAGPGSAGAGPGSAGAPLPGVPPGLDTVLAPLRDALLPTVPSELLVGTLVAWTSLVGMVSMELYGHYEGATTDFGAVFVYAMELAGRLAGL
ncbi:MAG TPA: helix-turn-helix domain-containing protein [Acidimicrobiales bacterium]|nr:helix-turn-helix domain-containing protein [Acidimicrobiales bacterium]